jgi:hypothetical protein
MPIASGDLRRSSLFFTAPTDGYSHFNRFMEALDYVRTGPSVASRDPDVLLLEATLLSHSGQHAAAEGLCSQILRIDDLNAGQQPGRARRQHPIAGMFPAQRQHVVGADFPRSSSGFEPGLRRQRAPPPGNGISGPETKAPKRPPKSNCSFAETKRRQQAPPIRGRFATRREISLNTGMRGGPGRTRTCNQTVMSGRL